MFRYLLWIAQGVPLFTALLLCTSAARAQTSSLSHVPARGAAARSDLRGLPPFGIYPGDRMFQAAMKISTAYQAAERSVPVVVYRRPAPRVEQEEATPVGVTVTEPEGTTEMVKIRGPNGEVRSFLIEGGRKAIKARTIIVRPGQSLHLTIHAGSVTVSTRR